MEAGLTTIPHVDAHGHNEADDIKPGMKHKEPQQLQQDSKHKEDDSKSRVLPKITTRQSLTCLLPATLVEPSSHLVLPTLGSGSFALAVADLKESGDVQAFVNAAAADNDAHSVAGSEKGVSADLSSSQSVSKKAGPGSGSGSRSDTSSEANLNKFSNQQRHENERDFELVGVKRDLTAIKTKKIHSIAVTAKSSTTTTTTTTVLTPSGKVSGRLDELSVNASSCNSMASIDITKSNGHTPEENGSEGDPNIDDLFSTIMPSMNSNVDSNGLGLGHAANRMLKDATSKEIASGGAHGEVIVDSTRTLEKIDESQSLASNVPIHGHRERISQKIVGDEGRGVLATGNSSHKRSSEHGAIEVAATTNTDDIFSSIMSKKKTESTSALTSSSKSMAKPKLVRGFSFTGINHIAFCVENLERSLDFYCGMLGLEKNLDRPDLPYRGAWLFLGTEGIHIMEVPNPDPVDGRPDHGGFDRHACINCMNVEGVKLALDAAGVSYQASVLPSLFTRDPDGNGLEFIEVSASKYNFLDA